MESSEQNTAILNLNLQKSYALLKLEWIKSAASVSFVLNFSTLVSFDCLAFEMRKLS